MTDKPNEPELKIRPMLVSERLEMRLQGSPEPENDKGNTMYPNWQLRMEVKDAKALEQRDEIHWKTRRKLLKDKEALEQQAEKWELEAKRLYGVGQDIEKMRVTLEQRMEGLEGGLGQIVEWSKAYPLDVFPEPDFKKAAELLKAGGMTLDAISASNMRHVVEGVGKIAKEALAAEEDK